MELEFLSYIEKPRRSQMFCETGCEVLLGLGTQSAGAGPGDSQGERQNPGFCFCDLFSGWTCFNVLKGVSVNSAPK